MRVECDLFYFLFQFHSCTSTCFSSLFFGFLTLQSCARAFIYLIKLINRLCSSLVIALRYENWKLIVVVYFPFSLPSLCNCIINAAETLDKVLFIIIIVLLLRTWHTNIVWLCMYVLLMPLLLKWILWWREIESRVLHCTHKQTL